MIGRTARTWHWAIAAILVVALVGCGGKAKEPKPRPEAPVKESQEPPKRLYTGAGEATVRDPEGERPVRYVIQWKSTELDYTLGEGASAGEMKGVTGVLYRDGKPASRFVAESAVANKDEKRLVLSGDVKVRSSDPKGELDCQRVEWKTDEKQLKAFGKVTIRLPQGTIGPVDEIWCLPDLKRAGTPGFYQR
jgi:hypothetical protein